MKVEVISQDGIRFVVELDAKERRFIKETLEEDITKIIGVSTSRNLDYLLKAIRDIL